MTSGGTAVISGIEYDICHTCGYPKKVTDKDDIHIGHVADGYLLLPYFR